LDTKFADKTFGDNSAAFFLSEPIVLPSDAYEWHILIPHATNPLVALSDHRGKQHDAP
jgi:hypothetical protein